MHASQIYAIAPRALPTVVDALVRHGPQNFLKYNLDRPLRLVHWMGQMAHESAGFTRLEENLNYSATRLKQVFPKLSSAECAEIAGNPRATANRVYGGRMGNTDPDDGWRYRGRGLIHLTGRDNYARLTRETGIDLIADPDRAAEPETAITIACAFWRINAINKHADLDDIERVTRVINGGTNGLADRRRLTERARAVLLGPEALRAFVLRKGSKSHAVALLQGELKELGFGIAADGAFGDSTEGHVRKFQNDRGLTVDGIVGPATWRALASALAEARRKRR